MALSRERVLRAAMSLADREGIGSLTMRRLAEDLGIEAMSLYHYVTSKNDILDGIVDMAYAEIEVPPNGPDWRDAMRRGAISAHRVLTGHRWAPTLVMKTREGGARLRYMESILRNLREAGFSAELTDHAYHALESHIVGFTLWVSGIPDERELKGLAASFLQALPADEFPHTVEHIHGHLSGASGDGGSAFEFGLDLILEGLERLRRAKPAARGKARDRPR